MKRQVGGLDAYTWLACALGNQACRQGMSVLYVRTSRLLEEMKLAHGDGSFRKRLMQIAKVELLVLDDWGGIHLDPI